MVEVAGNWCRLSTRLDGCQYDPSPLYGYTVLRYYLKREIEEC